MPETAPLEPTRERVQGLVVGQFTNDEPQPDESASTDDNTIAEATYPAEETITDNTTIEPEIATAAVSQAQKSTEITPVVDDATATPLLTPTDPPPEPTVNELIEATLEPTATIEPAIEPTVTPTVTPTIVLPTDTPTPVPAPTNNPNPSSKRGVGATFGTPNSCEDAFLLDGSWYYNWLLAPEKDCPANEYFVPRVWGAENVELLNRDIHWAKSAGWAIGFNEPNLEHQANIKPEQGAQLWRRLEEIARPHGIKLVSPAPNQDIAGKWPGDDYGNQWTWAMMDAYQAQYGEAPQFDALGWHIYNSDPNVAKNYLIQRRAEAEARGLGHLKFWVLEYAGCFVNNNPNQVMDEVTVWFEQQDWIDRYAWFFTRLPPGTLGEDTPCRLVNNDGTLTDLGQKYKGY